MNNGTNNFQNFIGISSLQKTLRNALIPTETTQQFIVKNGIIKEDELRGENRQILKDIMDDYYRGFISETLSSIDDIDWTSLFEKMEIQLKHGDNKDTLIKEQAEKRKAIYKKFADDDRFKNMFSAKLISDILPEFVIHNNNYSASEKEEKTQVIKLFSRFATSFKDYFKNRANCFSADDISSSSCHRIVNDNAEIFFSNKLVYRRIVKNLSNDDINKISGDMKDSLKEMSLEEIYSYEKYEKNFSKHSTCTLASAPAEYICGSHSDKYNDHHKHCRCLECAGFLFLRGTYRGIYKCCIFFHHSAILCLCFCLFNREIYLSEWRKYRYFCSLFG